MVVHPVDQSFVNLRVHVVSGEPVVQAPLADAAPQPGMAASFEVFFGFRHLGLEVRFFGDACVVTGIRTPLYIEHGTESERRFPLEALE